MTGECPFRDSGGWPPLVLHSQQGSGASIKADPRKGEGLVGRPWAPCHPDPLLSAWLQVLSKEGLYYEVTVYPQTRDLKPEHLILVSIPLESGNAGSWPALSPALGCKSFVAQKHGDLSRRSAPCKESPFQLMASALEEGWVAGNAR